MNGNDLVETDHVRRQYSGSTLYLMHNPRQRFYYMSKQSKDDVLIFKNFDSQRGIGAKCMYFKSLHYQISMIGLFREAALGISSPQSPSNLPPLKPPNNRCASCLLPPPLRNSYDTTARKHRSTSISVYASR